MSVCLIGWFLFLCLSVSHFLLLFIFIWKEVYTVSNDEKRNVGYLKPKSKLLVLLF